MSEKNRKHERYKCKLSAEFEYWEGIPDEIDIDAEPSGIASGWIVDWSKSGLLIVTNENLSINIPVRLRFKKSGKFFVAVGHIVRIGIFEDNPSIVDHLIDDNEVEGKFFIGITFDRIIDDLSL